MAPNVRDDAVLPASERRRRRGFTGPAALGKPGVATWTYPRNREPGLLATVDGWLEARAEIEGAEGLWRIDDSLYDLSNFIHRHPGGMEWLQLTKGTDITEAFYSHHLSEVAEQLLPKYYVRPAATLRNSPFTFHPNGFYMTMRLKAREVIAKIPPQVLEAARDRSRRINDTLAAAALLTSALAAALHSYLMGAIAGLLLSLAASCAHNFFHQKHNWRRFYFDMSLMSSRDWMISHALSHHMFPNTIQDLEVTCFEPVLQFLPRRRKSLVVRYLSWVYGIIMFAAISHGQLLKRITRLRKSDAVSLIVPASMLLTGSSVVDTWVMWTWVLVVSGFYLGFQGLSAGHHHPSNFHEGDAVRQEKDFGLMQLDATSTCSGLRGRESLWLCLTHFGDHRLHHFFPTLDHALLPLLEPAFEEHLREHGVLNEPMSSLEALRGMYLQLANNQPNPVPHGLNNKQ